MEGQWAPVQNPLELADDPQLEANGYLAPVTDAEGNDRRLVANPVQFDETPPDRHAGRPSSPSTPTTSCASSARARTRSSS